MRGGQHRRLHVRHRNLAGVAAGGAGDQLRFFYEDRRTPLRLPRQGAWRNSGRKNGFAEYANVSGLTGTLIASKLATLRELQEYYSFEDGLDMIEVLTVQNYNEWMATESGKNGR